MKTKYKSLTALFLLFAAVNPTKAQFPVVFQVSQPDLLEAQAGMPTSVLPGTTVYLGGVPAAKGGTPPYSYLWSPAAKVSDSTASHPTFLADSTTLFTLTVTDSLGCKASDTVSISLLPSSVNQPDMKRDIHVFPNPLSGNILFVSMEPPSNKEVTFIIRNTFGQIIFHQTKSPEHLFRLDLSSVNPAKGLYLLETGPENPIRKRIIVAE